MVQIEESFCITYRCCIYTKSIYLIQIYSKYVHIKYKQRHIHVHIIKTTVPTHIQINIRTHTFIQVNIENDDERKYFIQPKVLLINLSLQHIHKEFNVGEVKCYEWIDIGST